MNVQETQLQVNWIRQGGTEAASIDALMIHSITNVFIHSKISSKWNWTATVCSCLIRSEYYAFHADNDCFVRTRRTRSIFGAVPSPTRIKRNIADPYYPYYTYVFIVVISLASKFFQFKVRTNPACSFWVSVFWIKTVDVSSVFSQFVFTVFTSTLKTKICHFWRITLYY